MCPRIIWTLHKEGRNLSSLFLLCFAPAHYCLCNFEARPAAFLLCFLVGVRQAWRCEEGTVLVLANSSNSRHSIYKKRCTVQGVVAVC